MFAKLSDLDHADLKGMGKEGFWGRKLPSDSQAFLRVASWSKGILPTPLNFCIHICDYFSVFFLSLNFKKKIKMNCCFSNCLKIKKQFLATGISLFT